MFYAIYCIELFTFGHLRLSHNGTLGGDKNHSFFIHMTVFDSCDTCVLDRQ